ncbi:MAG: hypothetical protein IT450_21415 [Phycisphaerales bacterium]|nr:hypothetical protein [Phycisphaerales bacterium]
MNLHSIRQHCAIALIASLLAAPAFAAGLEEYSGDGTVFVIEDGRVVLVYDCTPSKDADLLVIDDVSDSYLISNGTKASILGPNTSPPTGTTMMVQLNKTGCTAIGQFEGTLNVVDQGNGAWSIEVVNSSSTLIFEYGFGQSGTSSSGGGCSATCTGGSCSCSEPGICMCWCGPITGTPYCLHISVVLGSTL